MSVNVFTSLEGISARCIYCWIEAKRLRSSDVKRCGKNFMPQGTGPAGGNQGKSGV